MKQKQTEDNQLILDEEYHFALETSDCLYCYYELTNNSCRFTFDTEEVFGLSNEQVSKPNSLIEYKVCTPESVDDYNKVLEDIKNGADNGHVCLHFRNIKTNVYRWYDSTFHMVYDSNKQPIKAMLALKDITEVHEKKLNYLARKNFVESHASDEISYFELSLTKNECFYTYGKLAEHVIKTASPHWSEMVGYLSQHLVSVEDRTTVQQFLSINHLLGIYEAGINESFQEYRGYRMSGKACWLRVSINMMTKTDTHEIIAFCVIEEVDEEKARELDRQVKQRRSNYYQDAYEKLASSVMYGVCKYNADENLTIIFANDIFYQMHGYACQEDAIEAGFTSILFATPPFGKKFVLAAHKEYVEGKTNQLFETEYPTVDADGKKIWILCRGIYSQEENIFNASVLNITDRKNTEEQLRISEERYRLALSQSGKVFFFFDVPSKTMQLSDDLAKMFNVPTVIDNMPDKFIDYGLLEPSSVEKYRQFFADIYAGNPNGTTIISCHLHNKPEQVLWFEMAFTSVSDVRGVPQSAIITYEDLQEEHARKIAGAWKQLNLISVPESKYVIAEYNLTQNRLISQVGGLFDKLPDIAHGYDGISNFVLEHFIYEEDVERLRKFLDRKRIMKMFEEGKSDDIIEYRSLQSGSSPRWTMSSIQMIRDSFSGDVLAQMLIRDIHAEKAGQIEMAQNIEELKKELENSRIKVMINQMQPHFLYNALSAIQTIVKTDPDYAYDLLYDFTVHLRSSVKALSSDAPIPFTDELKNIKAYLNIEQMRFGGALKVKYEIDCDSFSVIPLSIQPLAENAARHGVYPKGDDGGTVTIRTYETVDSYVVEVEDDGVGFNTNAVLEKNVDSVGLKSLIFRLKSLMNANVVINSKIGVGTKVVVTIPKEKAILKD